jgi:hypothetical protein
MGKICPKLQLTPHKKDNFNQPASMAFDPAIPISTHSQSDNPTHSKTDSSCRQGCTAIHIPLGRKQQISESS